MDKNNERHLHSGKALGLERQCWERFALRGVSRLTLVLFGFSVLIRAQTQGPKPTILVFNYSQASDSVIRLAEAEAARVLDQAKFPAAWVNCQRPASTSLAKCEKEQAPGEIRVRILPRRTKNEFQDSVFGFATAPFFASVYYESALRLARIDNAEFDAPVILGCVMVHEIGHLLLGPNSHSAIGIMQPRWGKYQVRQIMKGELVFTEEQSELIRAEVWRRTKLQAADALSASFPLGEALGQSELR